MSKEDPVQYQADDTQGSDEVERTYAGSQAGSLYDADKNDGRSEVMYMGSVHDKSYVTGDKEYFRFVSPGKAMPGTPGDQKDFEINWLGTADPGLPQNWAYSKKLLVLAMVAISAMVTVFGSAIIGSGIPQIMVRFHVGLPVATLNVSLYVLGFALGPIVWGPASEQMGRRMPIVVGIFGLTVFSFGAATAKDFQTLVLCRFFSGIMGASTLAVGPAVSADIFNTKERGNAMTIISLMIIAGPMLAPVIGGYISSSFLGWRWTQYILGIFSSAVLVCITFFLPESYPPILLKARAHEIRESTGNWAVSAPIENIELDTSTLVEKTLLKPLTMLFVEPILFLISLYHGFIYGILYLCLECVPLIFTNYGWKGGNVYLPYLGMLIGCIAVCFTNIFIFEKRFEKGLAKSGLPVFPELRLPLMMFSGLFFPIGIFLLCWSGAYKVFWFVPTLGCFFIGYGLIGIFLAAFNYIIDTYLMNAASGIAANTFLRSAFGCAFPLFAHPLFVNLGTQWAGTLLGCLAVLLTPVPFCFYFFGQRLRSSSKFAVDLSAMAPPKPEETTPPTSADSETHENKQTETA